MVLGVVVVRIYEVVCVFETTVVPFVGLTMEEGCSVVAVVWFNGLSVMFFPGIAGNAISVADDFVVGPSLVAVTFGNRVGLFVTVVADLVSIIVDLVDSGGNPAELGANVDKIVPFFRNMLGDFGSVFGSNVDGAAVDFTSVKVTFKGLSVVENPPVRISVPL